jgi:hypothetical protein
MSKVKVSGTVQEIQVIEKLFRDNDKTLLYHDGSLENSQYYSICYEFYPALAQVPKYQKVTLNEAMVMLVSSCFRVWFQYDYRKPEAHFLFGYTHYPALCKYIPEFNKIVNKLRRIEDMEYQVNKSTV